MSEKCRLWHISLDSSEDAVISGECLTLHAHTTGRTAVCPCCGKRTSSVYSYRYRKLQCTEWLGLHTTLIVKTRHMVCTNKDCEKKIFAEALAMTHPYGRHTYDVEVRTSGYVGLDDFAKLKGHKYMCVIADHYTRQVLAVFDSRYGQEITDWLKSHPEIKVVTRDGSQRYASIISAASNQIMQISDRFHLMQALKKDTVDPTK